MNAFARLAASIAVCGVSSLAFAQEADDIFKGLDKNNDGILVADEVSEAQQRFFERLVRAGDKNEDGKLSLAEYQATLKEDDRPVGGPDGRPPAGRGAFDPGAMFDRLDTNKDGKLAKSELPDGVAQRMNRLFEEAGKDEVSREEYLESMSKMMREGGRPGPGGRPPEGLGFFERLDANKDGKLSKDEIPEPMRERMAGLFERLGKDEIDLAEFARMRGERDGDRPREGRQEMRDGDRPREGRPEMRDGDRPREGRPEMRDGDRPREGRPEMRDGDRPREGRPEMRDGDRPREGRPEMRGPGRGPEGFAFMRVLDENRDGRISQAEALRVAKLFDELDHNNDGELDGAELMGFEGRPGGGPGEMARRGESDGRSERGRPEGDRFGGNRREYGEAFIARFDKDKDGAISKEEAPERMREGFDRLDQNKDGKLTAEEVGNVFGGRRPGGEGRPEGEGGRPRGEGGPRGDREGRPERPRQPEGEKPEEKI